MRISDWSSDVCSSDLKNPRHRRERATRPRPPRPIRTPPLDRIHHPGRNGPHLTEPGHRTALAGLRHTHPRQTGRASWRERECLYAYISVVDVSFKKQKCPLYTTKPSTKIIYIP